MRKYKPFIIYNPRKGWAFYVNRTVTPLTSRNIGNHRKTMRHIVGWFNSAQLACIFENRHQSI